MRRPKQRGGGNGAWGESHPTGKFRQRAVMRHVALRVTWNMGHPNLISMTQNRLYVKRRVDALQRPNALVVWRGAVLGYWCVALTATRGA